MSKVALLIGVSEYESGLNPLPSAVKDLDAMKEVLLDSEIGGFAETNVTLLKNPDRQVVEEAIYTLFANRQRDDLVLLFFSGHGIKDDSGTLYLATRGTRKSPQGELISPTAVSANFIHTSMSRSRSRRQVVILDSCFSGAFAEGLSAKDDGAVDIRTQLGGEGRAVLTSSSSTQYSFEQEGEELSLYTRFLIEGIKTGEADLDGDDFVSIDELHEYASRKVRDVKPELKPEIYAIREGFKIRLSKVPQGEPRQKYQKEVARCGKRGELTIVSRRILDTWRIKLGLSVDEAKALEDEVLEPYHQEFQQKLQQYKQAVTEVLQRDGSINDNTRQELQDFQKVLELRNEDTVVIETKVAAHLKTRKQSLQTYKEAFSEALRQEYPLGEATRSRLQQTRQQLALSDADVAPIETQITTEVEIYRRNLQQYEQAFVAATQQEYPLSEIRRSELRQHQQNLGLTDVEIAPIEAKVTTQIETYQQKLQQYEEAFASATQRKHQSGEATRTQLRQTWRTLGLSEVDVKAIEAPILAQIEIYQANLRRYEQEFADATEQQYPLSDATHYELRQRQQSLGLNDEDIAPIENRIIASIEEHLKNLQQYEQVFSDSIQFESPVSEATREELRRFQQVLELRDEEVAQLEEKVISQREYQAKLQRLTEEQHIKEEAEHQLELEKQQKLERQRLLAIQSNTLSGTSQKTQAKNNSRQNANKKILLGSIGIVALWGGLGVIYGLLNPTPSPTTKPTPTPISSPTTNPKPDKPDTKSHKNPTPSPTKTQHQVRQKTDTKSDKVPTHKSPNLNPRPDKPDTKSYKNPTPSPAKTRHQVVQKTHTKSYNRFSTPNPTNPKSYNQPNPSNPQPTKTNSGQYTTPRQTPGYGGNQCSVFKPGCVCYTKGCV